EVSSSTSARRVPRVPPSGGGGGSSDREGAAEAAARQSERRNPPPAMRSPFAHLRCRSSLSGRHGRRNRSWPSEPECAKRRGRAAARSRWPFDGVRLGGRTAPRSRPVGAAGGRFQVLLDIVLAAERRAFL